MAIEAATNCWTSAEDKLATALPNLAAFQSLTNTATAAAAAGHVRIDERDLPFDQEAFDADELAEQGAIIIVCSSGRNPYEKSRRLLEYFTASGRLVFYFERQVPPEQMDSEATENQSKQAIDRWLKNRLGTLFNQLADYWLKNGGPWIKKMGVSDGPYHNHPDLWASEGHFQGCECFVEWGDPDE